MKRTSATSCTASSVVSEALFRSRKCFRQRNQAMNCKFRKVALTARVIFVFEAPLWIGNIQSKDFVEICSKVSEIPVFEQELDIPTYYDLTEMTDRLGIRTPKILDVISKLKTNGRTASRTRLNPSAVRTDAPLPEIQSVLKELAL